MAVGVMKSSLRGVRLSPGASSVSGDTLFFDPCKLGFLGHLSFECCPSKGPGAPSGWDV